MAEEDPSWREWMRAAQQGDRAAYAALLTAVIPPLRRLVRARWPRAGVAEIEDAVQETLLALHGSRHLYDPARPFMPFLFGIMRFRASDVMRHTRRAAARETPIDDVPETSGALATNSTVDQTLDAGTLRAAIARLPAGQRQALEMTKLREMSLEEAATESGLSVTALKVAAHRGIKALRKLLDGSK